MSEDYRPISVGTNDDQVIASQARDVRKERWERINEWCANSDQMLGDIFRMVEHEIRSELVMDDLILALRAANDLMRFLREGLTPHSVFYAEIMGLISRYEESRETAFNGFIAWRKLP